MGGGWYLLGVQCFSVVCLTLWGLISTYPILWTVNKIIRIRMDPKDELIGADLVEHYMGDDLEKLIPAALDNVRVASTTFGNSHSQFTPTSYPYQNSDSYNGSSSASRRKQFQNNHAFEYDNTAGPVNDNHHASRL